MTEVTSTQTKPDTEIGYLLYTVKFLERITTTVLWKYSMSPDLSRVSCLCLIRSHQLHTARLLFTSRGLQWLPASKQNRTSANFLHCGQQRACEFNCTAAEPVTVQERKGKPQACLRCHKNIKDCSHCAEETSLGSLFM